MPCVLLCVCPHVHLSLWGRGGQGGMVTLTLTLNPGPGTLSPSWGRGGRGNLCGSQHTYVDPNTLHQAATILMTWYPSPAPSTLQAGITHLEHVSSHGTGTPLGGMRLAGLPAAPAIII